MSPSALEHTDHAMVAWCERNGLDATRIPADGVGALDVRPEQGQLVATFREVVDDDGTLRPILRRPVDSYPPTPAPLRRPAPEGDAGKLRDAAKVLRKEWGDPTSRRVYPQASRIHLALADLLVSMAETLEMGNLRDRATWEMADLLADAILEGQP